MFVIITDGEENASREYSLGQVRSMVEQHKEKDGWEFIFLGANINAVTAARSFGIHADRALDYVPDGVGIALNFTVMSGAIEQMRSNNRFDPQTLDTIRNDTNKSGRK